MIHPLIDKFKYLPDEIIHIILQFSDVIVFRHGKYMNRIDKKDDRYYAIRKIPRPIYIGLYTVLLRLTSYNYSGYFIKYDLSNERTKMIVRFFYREKDGFEHYYTFKSEDHYVFDINNTWSKIVYYLM